jgi:hypothetical protein
MKAKKLALLGLIAATIGLSFIFNPQTAQADGPTDAKAAGIISACKEWRPPLVAPSVDCGTYTGCRTNSGPFANGSICEAIGRLNDQVPGVSEDPTKVDCNAILIGPGQGRCTSIKACIATGKAKNDCMAGYAQCLNVNAGKTAECATLVNKGDLANALKKIPDPPPEGKTTCQIDGVGWIVCPVMKFLALIVDGAYTVVSALLAVQPLLVTGQTANIYTAWTYMRSFANVVFVIAFLVIIFSQLSSVGITNYGIKKMLPRLIIAAILVNISYWICAIAVDLSNILGSSVGDLFDSLKAQLAPPDSISVFASGNGWVGIVGGVLAGGIITGAALYITLSALAPILIAGLLAIVTTFLVLSLRQALIILLVIVSPLAFVAYLLPNTESWFKKWKDLLQTLLLMFPIISFIFGASALASQIVMNSATGDIGVKTAVQIMGAGIAIIPLAITPVIMKSAGGLLNRFGGIVNNPNKGPFDRMRKGAQGYASNRKAFREEKILNGGRTMPGRGMKVRAGVRREAVLNNRKAELARAKASYVATNAETDEGFRGQLARGGGDGADTRALASAINVQVELDAKEVKAASAVIEHMNLSADQLNSVAKGGEVSKTMNDGSVRALNGNDDATRKAAIQSAVAMATVGDMENLLIEGTPRTAAQNKVMASAMISSGIANKATHLGGQTLDDVGQGRINTKDDLDRVTARAIEGGKYSAEKLADNDATSLKRVADVLEQGRADISSEKTATIKIQADAVASNDRLRGRLTDAQKPNIQRIRPAGSGPIDP